MEQQLLKAQSQIIEAEATALEPGTPTSKMDAALVLILSSGFCGVVLGSILYLAHITN